MDNLTHSMVGAALAQTGLKKWTPLASTTLVIGANLPDVDIVVGLAGSLPYLEYHRGITHALAGLPMLAVVLALIIFGLSHLLSRRRPDSERARFLPLLALSAIGIVTHPLLDFLNSYGWRPFLPISNRWYYGDIAFVLDPWIWVILGGALLICTSKSTRYLLIWAMLFVILAVPVMLFPTVPIAGRVLWLACVGCCFAVGMTRPKVSGRLAVAALAGVVVYLCCLEIAHRRALDMTRPLEIANPGESVKALDAMPQPGTPFTWRAVVTTDQAYYMSDVSVIHSGFEAPLRYERQTGEPAAIEAAKSEPEIATFLRFARFPYFLTRRLPNGNLEVEVRDARFSLPTGRAGGTFQARVQFDSQMNRILER